MSKTLDEKPGGANLASQVAITSYIIEKQVGNKERVPQMPLCSKGDTLLYFMR